MGREQLRKAKIWLSVDLIEHRLKSCEHSCINMDDHAQACTCINKTSSQAEFFCGPTNSAKGKAQGAMQPCLQSFGTYDLCLTDSSV
jgi:hypothetical protein